MSNDRSSPTPREAAPAELSSGLLILLAVAVGVTAANLYYSQPLVGIIGRAIGLPPEAAGLVMTLTQLGYGAGILVAVPLSDLLENRRLVLVMMAITVAGLLGLAFVQHLVAYFFAAFATGFGASAVQVLVPFTAHLVPERRRGQTVGQLMSGLMLGIMLARPIASLLTDLISWHAVFVLSAALMVLLIAVLARVMPRRQPDPLALTFPQLLASMGRLLKETPVLRRRALYQALMFGAFCLFWTASPLLLAGPRFDLSQTGIAIFALVGVAGAISAPLAGRAADRGRTPLASVAAFLAAAGAMLLGHFIPGSGLPSLALLALSAILLDAGVSANLVLGQRAIFALPAQLRGRLNALYIAIIFIGGAAGSALGAWAHERGGWSLTTWVGFALPVAALGAFLTERPASVVRGNPARLDAAP
jgi:predicted MFS family arabinose efflux permease